MLRLQKLDKIITMLSNNETNAIKKILSRQKGSLLQIEQDYFNCFKEAISLFNAASYLSELLLNHKLELEERMISLYLLLVSFQDEHADSHPFVMNILFISSTTDEPVQRTMIYDILIRGNKSKYSSYLIEDLQLLKEKEKQLTDQQKEIKNLRHRAQEKYKHFQMTLPLSNYNDSMPQFLRLVPQYLPISTSQLNWLSPGIISDVQWDNSAEIDKKLEKCRKIFQSALKRSLQQQQRTQLLNSIQSDPYSPLHIGFGVKDLNELLIHNPYIAASLVIKLSKYPVFQQYMQQFLALPTTVPLLDAIARIIKEIRVPQAYIAFFCSHHMNKMVKTREAGENYKALTYTMSAFLRCMFENQIVTAEEIASDLKNFINQFSNIMDFGHIKTFLEQKY